jgi:hypothetical protein
LFERTTQAKADRAEATRKRKTDSITEENKSLKKMKKNPFATVTREECLAEAGKLLKKGVITDEKFADFSQPALSLAELKTAVGALSTSEETRRQGNKAADSGSQSRGHGKHNSSKRAAALLINTATLVSSAPIILDDHHLFLSHVSSRSSSSSLRSVSMSKPPPSYKG